MTERQRPEPIPSEQELAEFLLGSARNDDPAPEALDAAWARFAHSMVTVGASVATSPAPHQSSTPSGQHLLRRAAAKWFVAGAIGGAMTTAACFAGWYQLHAQRRAPERVVAASIAAVAQGSSVPAPAAPVQEHLDVGQSVVTTASAIAAPVERSASNGSVPSAKLAEQVALLDAVGRAVARGATDEALRLVAEYHQRFPHGTLAADAEALAIQALTANGSNEAARSRARRFLKKYPNDPHAGSLRAIAEGAERQ